MRKVLIYLAELLANILLISIGVALAIAVVLPLINQPSEKVVEKIIGEEDIELKGSFATEPETIIGIAPTSTVISSYNTENVATGTATTTDYFFLGPNVNRVRLNLIANASSTDNKSFLYSYEVSNGKTASTTLTNFFTDLTPVSSGLFTIASSTKRITLPSGGTFYKLSTLLCDSNYDGTDDIFPCSVGLYKFRVGVPDGSGVQLNVEIDRE